MLLEAFSKSRFAVQKQRIAVQKQGLRLMGDSQASEAFLSVGKRTVFFAYVIEFVCKDYIKNLEDSILKANRVVNTHVCPIPCRKEVLDEATFPIEGQLV
jgi:hypothetical protein